MFYPNQQFFPVCNRDQIFMSGFMSGFVFFAITLRFLEEFYLYFKVKGSKLIKYYKLDEKSDDESDEKSDGESRNEELDNNSVKELRDEMEENLSEKSCKDNVFRPNEPSFYIGEERDAKPPKTISPTSESDVYIYRTSGKYATMGELEDLSKKFKEDQAKVPCNKGEHYYNGFG